MEKNSSFYVDQFNTLQESAKNACIELLKENPAGRYIDLSYIDLSDEEDFSDAIWVMTGNAEAICIDAIGLNEKNELVFKGIVEVHIDITVRGKKLRHLVQHGCIAVTLDIRDEKAHSPPRMRKALLAANG